MGKIIEISLNTFGITKKVLRYLRIAQFRILLVTQFQNRNTPQKPDRRCRAGQIGGCRARPAYRLYPALFSTHRKFAKMPRQISAVASLLPYGVTALASAENPTQACHGPCRV